MSNASVNRQINKSALQEILDAFTVITGIRVAFMDENASYVVGRHRENCSFCKKLREDTRLDAACKACDLKAFDKVSKEREAYIYRCHIGLAEAVVPLIIAGKNAGFLMLGQVRCAEDGPHDWDRVYKRLGACFSPEVLLALEKDFKTIAMMSMEAIQASVRMLQIIGQYVVANELINIRENDSIEKAKLLLKENYQRKLDIHALADHVGLNASYLSHLFKKTTGVTLTVYLDKIRMEHAGKLLLNTARSVKEIAADSGYDDPNYFSRVFKKYKGMSPLRYRQQIDSH